MPELPAYVGSMTEPAQRISYDRISGTIGSMVWLWAEIERSLKGSILTMGGEVSFGISSNLRVWSGLMQSNDPACALQNQIVERVAAHLTDALRIRNAICHGLTGISAQREDVAACLWVQLGDGPEERLEWDRLKALFDWMSRCEGVIANLTGAAREADPVRRARLVSGLRNFPGFL